MLTECAENISPPQLPSPTCLEPETAPLQRPLPKMSQPPPPPLGTIYKANTLGF